MTVKTLGPGIHKLSDADYFSLLQISKSSLDMVARSPAFFRYWKTTARPKTKAMEIGSATHSGVLEPETFEKTYACAPEVDRRTSAGKAAYAKWLEQNPGRTPLDRDDFDMVLGMRNAVRGHKIASWLLREGEAEQAIIWTDADTGIECKGKMDWVDTERDLIAELKTTESAQRDAFAKSIVMYGYHRQAAFYSDGYQAVTGRKPKYAFIVVEKGCPYHVSTFIPDEKMIEIGRQENKALLRTYAECVRTDTWPGYPEEFREISLPIWFSRAG